MLTGRIAQLAARIGSEFRKLSGNIGDLSELNTPNKESIVSAVNSITLNDTFAEGGTPGQILTLGENNKAEWTNPGNYSNVFSLETSTQLNESHFGSLIFAGLDTAGVVMTLPQSNEAAKGKKITISSNRAGVTVNPYSGDHIRFCNFANTENGFFLPGFSVVSMVSNGNGNWTVVSEVPCGNLSVPGYYHSPSGLLLQWGTGIGSGKVTITFPTPFTYGFCACITQNGGDKNGAAFSCNVYPTYLEVWPSYNLVSVERSFFYLAIGVRL